MKNTKKILFITIVLAVILIPIMCYLALKNEGKPIEVTVTAASEFNPNIIRMVNQIENKNYLISPYSIETALSMLRAGADGDTKTQINNLIGNRKINNITVPNRINVANALFVKSKTKDHVVPDYYQKLKTDYKANIMVADYKTYKPINDWVNKETKGMISKLRDDSQKTKFDMLIANAVAIDVEWATAFNCDGTQSEEFTKQDGNIEKVSMMHKTYKNSAKYFDLYDAKGIILPYKSYDEKGKPTYEGGNNLEFIGILPNMDIKTYVNNITDKILADIDNNSKEISTDLNLKLSIPTFNYDYSYDNFVDSLKSLGIIDVFDKNKSDLTNMLTTNGYVSEAMHKTHIDVKEKGTKAAAVTAFGVTKGSARVSEEKPEIIEIEFNKPFAYIIRDSKTKEMLFFGVVYEPNKWQGSTCKEE